jgi:pimeloyl-ACP methyl ester carboxylesterase
MPDTVVNGVRLHHEEAGDGAPLLCIHGGGSSALMWEDAVEELARRGRAILYDRRGCSRSERPQPYQTSVAQQAADGAALLRHLSMDPAVVIARSYGGAVAVELALRHPERVRALALLEGDALGLSPAALEWTKGMRDDLRRVADERGMDAVYPALIERVMGEGAWAAFPAEAREILTANGEALLAELDYVDQPMPGQDDFAAIAAPVLLVAARDSPPEQREMTAAMHEALPDSRLESVEGGHLIDPAAPPVLAFLDDLLRS